MTRLVLASASPARAMLLRNAGIEPIVRVSGVDEDAIVAHNPGASVSELTELLAQAKCRSVAELGGFDRSNIVIGCDSIFEFEGQALGKPGDPATATARLRQASGASGVLHTGHWVVKPDVDACGVGSVVSTRVTFGHMSDDDIDEYVATGEPLGVAGSFTLDSRGGAFIERIEGDPLAVIGLSLHTARDLCRRVGVTWTSLWNPASS